MVLQLLTHYLLSTCCLPDVELGSDSPDARALRTLPNIADTQWAACSLLLPAPLRESVLAFVCLFVFIIFLMWISVWLQILFVDLMILE